MKTKIKARRMHYMELHPLSGGCIYTDLKQTVFPDKTKPVAVIDVSDEAALIEQVADAAFQASGIPEYWKVRYVVQAALTSLGIIRKPRAPRPSKKGRETRTGK